jgi:hypothetical protein
MRKNSRRCDAIVRKTVSSCASRSIQYQPPCNHLLSSAGITLQTRSNAHSCRLPAIDSDGRSWGKRLRSQLLNKRHSAVTRTAAAEAPSQAAVRHICMRFKCTPNTDTIPPMLSHALHATSICSRPARLCQLPMTVTRGRQRGGPAYGLGGPDAVQTVMVGGSVVVAASMAFYYGFKVCSSVDYTELDYLTWRHFY